MAVTYVLIGGGLASARAAEAIRERDAEGQVVIVGREPELPYNRPDLSKGYLLGKRPLAKVYFKPKAFADAQAFYRERNIEVVTNNAAVELDAGERRVRLADGRVLGYDRLLLATGARPRTLDLPGAQLANIFYLRSLADADALRAAVSAVSASPQEARQAVVVGGGFIGAEAAAGLTMLGLQVTLVLRDKVLLERALGAQAGRTLTDYFVQHGVRVLTGVTAAAFEGDEQLRSVMLGTGEVLPAGLAVVGAGVVPDVDLARQAGLDLALGPGGGVNVDEYLRTSRPEIYAAGDVAAFASPLYGRRMRIEHWDHARQSGRVAGLNMAGAGQAYTALPYFYSDLFDLDLQAYGDLYEWDEVVSRGPVDLTAKPGLTQFYLYRNVVKGVLYINPPDDGSLDALRALVQQMPALDEAGRARLADAAAPLP
jgi:3-phenylpropionate/trans-cinnamate dioxygenase ferredoxin reductase subunit